MQGVRTWILNKQTKGNLKDPETEETLLMQACKKGLVKLVNLFLYQERDINSIDRQLKSALIHLLESSPSDDSDVLIKLL